MTKTITLRHDADNANLGITFHDAVHYDRRIYGGNGRSNPDHTYKRLYIQKMK